MRYEYLILPPAPSPWPVRLLAALRVLFRHPGYELMIGLGMLYAVTLLAGR
ncbi:MAG TPA: hypothetical protein VJ817_04895 [Gemmatimonadales bacterium]|nr:hypothetical protein [Gemmatimonadales bacterium]